MLLGAISRRLASTRPGQPLNLTRYNKGLEGIPIPGTILTNESERLGRTELPGSLKAVECRPRDVPKSAVEFNRARKQYQNAVHEYRKAFGEQVRLSKARIDHAVAAFREGVMERKQELDALKAVRKAALAEKSKADLARQREAKRLRAELRRRQLELRLARVDERRQQWLDALEEDSKRWVSEKTIDEQITPDLFRMKYAWQFERWFEVKEHKKTAWEHARRSKKPGQPLREVVLAEEDQPYDSTWESDGEGDVAAADRLEGSLIADTDASADGTGRVAAALAAAREIARDRDRGFPEPAYDASGNLLMNTRARVEKMTASSGIQLAELFEGKSAKQIVDEYEAWIEGSKSSTAAAGDDDGERAAENAYIAFVASTNRLEALYYALLRKRRRLTSSAYYQMALDRFDSVWGDWLKEVDTKVAELSAGTSVDPLHDKIAAGQGKQHAVSEEDVAALTSALFGSVGASPVDEENVTEKNLRAADLVAEVAPTVRVPGKSSELK